MKRLFVILFAVVLSSATFGEIRYCEKGTKNEHSHFSSHDVPLAKGVRVKQKGPVGYSCKTNDHPLVVWSRSFDGWRADFSIDVRPIDRKKSDLYVKWIKAEQIKGKSAQMSVGAGGLAFDTNGKAVTLGPTLGPTRLLTRNLAHRWSFNGDATDSVGNMNATLMGENKANITYDNGEICLSGLSNNSTKEYIALGAGCIPSGRTALR